MYLAKCACGGFFTFGEMVPGNKADRLLKCQNCGASTRVYRSVEYRKSIEEIEEAGFRISRIPDNAKITVTFDA